MIRLPFRSIAVTAAGAALATTLGVVPMSASHAASPVPVAATPPARVATLAAAGMAPLAKLIGAEIGKGVLGAIGATAFGKVLSTVMTDPTAAALQQIQAQLTHIQNTLNALDHKTDSLLEGVSNSTLTTLTAATAHTVSIIDAQVARVALLAKNEDARGNKLSPTTRQDWIHQFNTVIGNLYHHNGLATLNSHIANHAGTGILHIAFQVEHDRAPRFYTNETYARGQKLVEFYEDESAALLWLYSEYLYAPITKSTLPDHVQNIRSEVESLSETEMAFLNKVTSSLPKKPEFQVLDRIAGTTTNRLADFHYVTVTPSAWAVDKKELANGKHTVWFKPPRWWGWTDLQTTVPRGELDRRVNNEYKQKLVTELFERYVPSLADFRHLASAHPASGSEWLTNALKEQGFTPPLSCTPNAGDNENRGKASVPVHWTSDWAELFGLDNAWQGRATAGTAACMNLLRYDVSGAAAKTLFQPAR